MGPAFAIVGGALVVIVICETEGAQGAFAIDHCKTVVPAVKPVIVVAGLFGEVIEPGPDNIDHVPKPAAGAFPAIVGLVPTQTV